MQINVLNPQGNDPEQAFSEGAGVPNDRVHAPVNYHAYAACTRGTFYREAVRIPHEQRAIVLLLRRDLKLALKTIAQLQANQQCVAVAWKECGKHQIAEQLESEKNVALFREVCTLAGAAISATPELVSLYRDAGAQVVEFIPTPYPIEDERWNFSMPLENRAGIFIGTRKWDEPTRHHAATIARALEYGVPVTVCNVDGRAGQKKLSELISQKNSHLKIIEGPLPYTEYLRAMSKARIVLQGDQSEVPGQVAGDALLCRMPCVGGNSAIEQLAFHTAPSAETLLRDDVAWALFVRESQKRAIESLSYTKGAEKLGKFFSAFHKKEGSVSK